MSIRKAPRVGDVGTELGLVIYDSRGDEFDVSSSSVRQIKFQRPSGTFETQNAVFVTDGEDGAIMYVTETDFLDEDGLWRMQGYVETPGGQWHTEIEAFQVAPNLE